MAPGPLFGGIEPLDSNDYAMRVESDPIKMRVESDPIKVRVDVDPPARVPLGHTKRKRFSFDLLG